MAAVQIIELYNFVSKNTLKLFTALDLPQDFLKQYPSVWENNKDFIDDHISFQKLIVDDAAEHGISLV